MGRSLHHPLSVLSVCRGQTGTASTAAAMVITGTIVGATIGVGVSVFGAPAVLSALGFQAAGVAAGSIAAKMISAAAIANNGGVAAGSIVAVLQSFGAAGLPVGAQIGLTSIVTLLGAAVDACL